MKEHHIKYREFISADVSALAEIRSQEWGDIDYWQHRIDGYINGEIHPQQALMPRIIFVAIDAEKIVGFIAGHLTKRFDCEGELEWINVSGNYRGMNVASNLLKLLAEWFIKHKSFKICIDVDPKNKIAQNFYRKHGAENLNEHWLFWKDIRIINP